MLPFASDRNGILFAVFCEVEDVLCLRIQKVTHLRLHLEVLVESIHSSRLRKSEEGLRGCFWQIFF